MGHIVLLLFSFFTEAVILWQYASSLFTSSYSSKIRLALLSALYTILFLLSLLEQTGLNVVSFFVFNTVFLYMLFKLKLLLALFHSAILTAIMGISEIAVLGITSRFFPHFLFIFFHHQKCKTGNASLEHADAFYLFHFSFQLFTGLNGLLK